ncbi:hypothetical protein A1F97_02579 [Pyrenophora tritici-repentis]|nr:hypothetical protein A1F95_04398 [Pyrenophora tritici-repentis]PZD43871.1 hypothetical protein A1F97_02579 [Pyrenophora tritici-repentis]
MPVILTATTRRDSQHDSTDKTQLFIILVVVGILLFETFLAIAYIRYHNLSSKARWRRLRERGVVVVNGPALIWTDTLPPAPTTSTFNLHHLQQRDTPMSVFAPTPTPIPGSSRKQRSVPETVIILVIVTAVGLSIVVGFVLFVVWFRMKKKRQQHEATIQLEELTRNGYSLRRPVEHEIGVAR